jgi:hypothetical protein
VSAAAAGSTVGAMAIETVRIRVNAIKCQLNCAAEVLNEHCPPHDARSAELAAQALCVVSEVVNTLDVLEDQLEVLDRAAAGGAA